MRISILARVAGFAGVLALAGAGCNPIQNLTERIQQKAVEAVVEKAVESKTGGDVSVDLGSDKGKNAVTFRDEKTGDYTAWGESVDIPSDFPTDVPRMEGAKVMQVSISKKGKSGSLTSTLEGEVAQIATQLDDAAKAMGYTRTSTVETSDTTRMMTYEKGDADLTVTVASSDDQKKEVIVTVVKEGKE